MNGKIETRLHAQLLLNIYQCFFVCSIQNEMLTETQSADEFSGGGHL